MVTLAATRSQEAASCKKQIIFRGTIIGEGQRVACEVRATKATLHGDPPVFSNYRIMESDLTDRLPDGNYELLVNRERTRFRRDAGRSFHAHIDWFLANRAAEATCLALSRSDSNTKICQDRSFAVLVGVNRPIRGALAFQSPNLE